MIKKLSLILIGLLLVPIIITATAPSIILDINPNPVVVVSQVEVTVLVGPENVSNISSIAIYLSGQSVGSHDCKVNGQKVLYCFYTFKWTNSTIGEYPIYAEVTYEEEGIIKSAQSATQTLRVVAAPTSPSPPTGGTIGNCPAGQICNPLAYDNVEELINAVIRFLIMIGTPIAAIMFVIAGIVFVTSAGDPGRARTARSIMIYTAVGLAVMLVASGLIKVLQSLLGGS